MCQQWSLEWEQLLTHTRQLLRQPFSSILVGDVADIVLSYMYS